MTNIPGAGGGGGLFLRGAHSGSKLSCPARQQHKRNGDKFYRTF